MSIPPRKNQFQLSRRGFFKGLGITAVATAADGAKAVAEQLHEANAEKIQGPGAVPITLRINGENVPLELEPRVTLLDALRNHTALTGAKEVCDRATCGACSVLFDGTLVYACMKLAIDAQGHEITTVEGLSKNGELTAVQKAFIECDGLQCGYCTPGFILATTVLLQKNPTPNDAEIRKGCSGNLCRCGSYPKIFAAVKQAAGTPAPAQAEVIRLEGTYV